MKASLTENIDCSFIFLSFFLFWSVTSQCFNKTNLCPLSSMVPSETSTLRVLVSFWHLCIRFFAGFCQGHFYSDSDIVDYRAAFFAAKNILAIFRKIRRTLHWDFHKNVWIFHFLRLDASCEIMPNVTWQSMPPDLGAVNLPVQNDSLSSSITEFYPHISVLRSGNMTVTSLARTNFAL